MGTGPQRQKEQGCGCTLGNVQQIPSSSHAEFPCAHGEPWDLTAISQSSPAAFSTFMAHITCLETLHFGLGGHLSATPEPVADGAGRALGEDDCLHEQRPDSFPAPVTQWHLLCSRNGLGEGLTQPTSRPGKLSVHVNLVFSPHFSHSRSPGHSTVLWTKGGIWAILEA